MARPGKYLRARRGTARASAALLLALALPAALPAASPGRWTSSSGENRIRPRWPTWPSRIFDSWVSNPLTRLWNHRSKGDFLERDASGRRPLVAGVRPPSSFVNHPYSAATPCSLSFRVRKADTVAVTVDGVLANGSGDGPAAVAAIRVFQLAVETYAANHPYAAPETVLSQSILETDQELRQRSGAPHLSVTAVFHHGSRATVASVGGGAALLVRDNKVSLLAPNRRRPERTRPPNAQSTRLGDEDRRRERSDSPHIRIERVELEPGDRIVVGSPGLGQLRAGRGTSVIERMETLILDYDERAPDSDIANLLAKLAARDGHALYGATARNVAAVLLSFSEPAQK